MKPVPAAMPPVQDDAAYTPEICIQVNAILAAISSRWAIMVIRVLGRGSRRFSELRRELDGVSQKMLTATLRALERDGLIRRHVTPGNLPRVDYALTDLGHSLLVPIDALAGWALDHRTAITAARASFDARADDDGWPRLTVSAPAGAIHHKP